MRYYSRVPILLVAIGLVASLWTAARRIVVERAGRTVELTVDMEQLRPLALSLGVPIDEVLKRLKAAGVTSVALGEQTLAELETDGIAQVSHGTPELPPGVTRVRFPDPAYYQQVAEALSIRIRATTRGVSGGSTREVRLEGPDRASLTVPAGWSAIRSLPIGLAREDGALARAHGLGVVARVGNFAAADAATIAATADRLRRGGAHLVVFAGEEVLGNRARIKETAAALDARGIRYGSVEFGKQMGDETLARALQGRIVRVHSIQTAEMQKLDVAGVVDRFAKAAEERNIRLLYLRLLPHVADEPFEDNVAFVAAIAQALRERGLTLGRAEPFARVYPETRASLAALLQPAAAEAGQGALAGRLVSRFVPALSALAVAGGAVLLLAGLVMLRPGPQARLAFLAGLAAVIVVLIGGDLGRKLVALAGAMLFPVLAFVLFPPAVDGAGTRQRVRGYPVGPRSPLAHFALITLVTLVGALTVVGLLSERQFMVKVTAFMGIKAAHFLPLLVIAALYVAGALERPRPWSELKESVRQNLGRFMGERLQIWHLAAGLMALIAIGLLLARTGNDAGVGVSGTEMSLRNLLDRYLVRPRTKEFLIGHPALLAALLLAAARVRTVLLVPLAIIGAIGQVSMMNSFCHLHTPLVLTVFRTLNGLWLGILLGVVLAWALKRLTPKSAPAVSLEPAAFARTGTGR